MAAPTYTIDLAKQSTTIMRLDDYFSARTSDSNVPLRLQVIERNENNQAVPHRFQDGESVIYKQASEDKQTLSYVEGTTTIINANAGIIDLRFPSGTFNTVGDVTAFFSLVDGKGTQISGSNTLIHVEPDFVDMYWNGKPFASNIEAWKAEIQSEFDEFSATMHNHLAQLDQLATDNKNSANSVSALLDSYRKLISDNAVALLSKGNEFVEDQKMDKGLTVVGNIQSGDINAGKITSSNLTTSDGNLNDLLKRVNATNVVYRGDITFDPAPETTVNNPFKAWDYPNGDGHGMIFMNTGFTYNNRNVGQPAWNNFNAGTINNLPKQLPYMVILPHFAIVSNGNVARVDVNDDGRLKVGSLAHTIEVGDTVEFSQMFLY